jgi:hypothetical protein
MEDGIAVHLTGVVTPPASATEEEPLIAAARA